eukprot:2775023-Pleurochrysis_carterae.AAC.2
MSWTHLPSRKHLPFLHWCARLMAAANSPRTRSYSLKRKFIKMRTTSRRRHIRWNFASLNAHAYNATIGAHYTTDIVEANFGLPTYVFRRFCGVSTASASDVAQLLDMDYFDKTRMQHRCDSSSERQKEWLGAARGAPWRCVFESKSTNLALTVKAFDELLRQAFCNGMIRQQAPPQRSRGGHRVDAMHVDAAGDEKDNNDADNNGMAGDNATLFALYTAPGLPTSLKDEIRCHSCLRWGHVAKDKSDKPDCSSAVKPRRPGMTALAVFAPQAPW